MSRATAPVARRKMEVGSGAATTPVMTRLSRVEPPPLRAYHSMVLRPRGSVSVKVRMPLPPMSEVVSANAVQVMSSPDFCRSQR